jgi:hypothetical protein
MAAVTYKALKPCRMGGMYRRAGDVFTMEELAEVPPFLKKVTTAKAPKEGAPKPKEGAPKVGQINPKTSATPEDLGVKKE